MSVVPSLTQVEPAGAALLEVQRYDLAVDLTGLLAGDALPDWTVLTSAADPVVTDVEGARRWVFPDTRRTAR